VRAPPRGRLMHPLRDTLSRLLLREHLSEADSEALLLQLTDPQTPPAMAGALLAALQAKRVVATELRGLARGMRRLARRPEIPSAVRGMDIVGTGGDGVGSLNISTGTSLLAAACGIPVLKHGNRSVSSRSGSADVLEALGLRLPLDEHQAGACLQACNFTFLFAPYYHPAMKSLAPVRAALGVRTVFNILGPLSNPAAPPWLLIGAYSLEVAQLMAETLAGMELERAFVVHGAQGWDEPTPIGPFALFDIHAGRIDIQTRTPGDYGLATCAADCLMGGDASHNAAALRAVLCAEDLGPHRDCLLLGAALALEVSGRAASVKDAVAQATHAIDSGAARRTLADLGAFSAAAAAQARLSAAGS
jgi:anthranilate phosphoribosyltransferase